MRRTITGDNKLNDFNPEQINEVLCAETAKKYESSNNVILIHDPSEIRKKYTKQAEHIGKVKDLSKKTINGVTSNFIWLLTAVFVSHWLRSFSAPYTHKVWDDQYSV